MGKKEKIIIPKPPSDYFGGVTLDIKSVHTAIANLSSVEVPILIRCASSLYAFIAKDRNGNALIVDEMGGIGKLAELICHADVQVRRYSLMTLALAAHLTTVARQLIRDRRHLLPRLVKLCQQDDQVAVEFASRILAELSKFTRIRDDLGGLESTTITVTGLFCYQDPDVKKHTLTVLINLATDFTLVDGIADYADCIVPYCLKNLQSQFPIIQQLSMELLNLLCHEQDAFEQFVECDGINQILTYLLNAEFAPLHGHALKILTHVWINNAQAFIDNDSMEKVVTSILASIDTGDGETNAMALCRLIKATVNNVNDKRVLQSLSEILVKLIQSQNDEAKVAAMEATVNLAKNELFSEIANESELSGRVLSLIGNGSDQIRRLALISAAELIKTHSPTKVILLSQNMSSQLMQLMLSDDYDESVAVVSILTSLAIDDEPFRHEIVDLGLLTQLAVVHQSALYLERFLDLISVYATTPDTIKTVTDSAVLGEIVNLIQSSHLAVRTKAAQLIGRLCQNSAVFDVLQSAGALDRLHRVNQSGHLNTNVSEDIERQLLSYNLSRKMAHFNTLDETDRIDHTTYYDCGANPYDTLEVLNEQPVASPKTTPIWLVKIVSDLEINNNDAETVITVTQSQEDTQSNKSSKGKKDKKKNKKRMTEVETPDLMTNSKRATLAPMTPINDEPNVNVASRTPSKMGFDPSDSHASLQSLKTEGSDHDTQLVEFIESIDIIKDDHLEQQISTIAQAVTERFGGVVVTKADMDELRQAFNAEIVNLRRLTNVLQLGHVNVGLMRERAIAFKVTMDFYAIPCTLERSQSGYGKVWNTVRLSGKTFIVDLMRQPGRLLHGAEAYTYITF